MHTSMVFGRQLAKICFTRKHLPLVVTKVYLTMLSLLFGPCRFPYKLRRSTELWVGKL